ncbi:hypothetical protein DFH06DRAFT_1042280 [Mycena polygramma]|nr:hypothetical protein DFH06DRAFT_1042280 [Mycena polygramma]
MNRQEEAAAAKLWAVYVSEAEKYDRGLVESWKSDMEGLLIFAALFSSILTAFIIESYQSLNPDPGDLTVHLLAQISQQLAASANGSTFSIPPPTSFAPSISSIICNTLWFTSLGFSLTCALVATFVQQWARDFLHKTDMRSAPVIRARIFSYLYYGLKRFQMHTVVEIIPLLLHGSLLLFLCGLVAFLIPVNLATTVIASAILGTFTAVYCTLTLLPLCYLDCPYRTPLSGAFWRVFRALQRFRCRRHMVTQREVTIEADRIDDKPHPSPNETMVEAMFYAALETRSERDHKALVWTMKSLADDGEFEPFAEAIPDLLWGPGGRRRTYEGHIRGLIHNGDVQLLDRITTLLTSCDAGILSPEDVQRREITCYKAIWAIGSLSDDPNWPSSDGKNKALDLSVLTRLTYPHRTFTTPYAVSYRISAKALVAWSTFLVIEVELTGLREKLAAYEADFLSKGIHSGVEEIALCLRAIRSTLEFLYVPIPEVPTPRNQHAIIQLGSWIEIILSGVPCHIALAYFSDSACSDSLPYRWLDTREILLKALCSPTPISLQATIEREMTRIISHRLDRLNNDPDDATESDWVLYSIADVLSLWTALDTNHIHWAIIYLLNHSKHDRHLRAIFCLGPAEKKTAEIHLWSCFPKTMLDASSGSPNTITALWRLVSIGLQHHYYTTSSRLASAEELLSALSTRETPFAGIAHSVIAMLKVSILRDRNLPTVKTQGMWDDINTTSLRSGDVDAGLYMPDENGMSAAQWKELRNLGFHRLSTPCLDIVAEYLEHCTCAPDNLPYKAAETFHKITHAVYLTPAQAIHPSLQIRLANSIQAIFSLASDTELLDQIVICPLWAVYGAGIKTKQEIEARRNKFMFSTDNSHDELPEDPRHRFWPWLDNPEARRKIKQAFAGYEVKLNSMSQSTSHVLPQLQQILAGMDSWHPEHLEEVETEGEGRNALVTEQ